MASEDLRRYGAVLEELLAVKAMSRRAVEKKLGWSQGTLTKLLQGKNELKVGSLLDILGALNVAPLDFYNRVHNDSQRDSNEPPIVTRIMKSFGPSEDGQESLTLPRNLGKDELEALIESVVRRILSERA